MKHGRNIPFYTLAVSLVLALMPAGPAAADPGETGSETGRTARFVPRKAGDQPFPFFGGGRLRFDPAEVSTAKVRSASNRSFGPGKRKGGGIGLPIEVRESPFSLSAFPNRGARFQPRGTVYHFEPEGLVFTKPAELTLPYESRGGDDALLEVYHYNRELGRWELQPEVSRDAEAKTITVKIEHFSDYVVGMSTFKIDEAGTLDGGSRLGPSVDPYFGALTIENSEFHIPARGLPLSLSTKFNSDYLYRKYVPDLTGSETTAGLTRVWSSTQVYSLPQTDIKSGWFYQLPYCTFGKNTLDLVLGDGRKYDLSNCVFRWRLLRDGKTEDYGTFFKLYRLNDTTLKILIPEARLSVFAKVKLLPRHKDDDISIKVTSVKVYFEDGSSAHFPSSGPVKYLYDPSGKNRLTYSFNGNLLQSVTHTDGRTVKILKYASGEGACFVYLLSTSPDLGVLNEGDRFLGRRVFDGEGRLLYSDSLETLDFDAAAGGFALTSENEAGNFRVLQRTAYTYSLGSGVDGNFIAIDEPGNGYRKFIFGRSFGPEMVSRKTVSSNHGDGIDRNILYYQNKPKILSAEIKVVSESTSFLQQNYLYTCSHSGEHLFTSSSWNRFGYPLSIEDKIWNTTPATTSKTAQRVTPSGTDPLTSESISYAHETGAPFVYKGVSQERTLMYDGAEAGTSREYEKTARTFSKIYGSYYPLVETVYRGGSSTAAWTVTNAYDAFGRVVTRNDSRAGNSCVYYLYNGAAGSAAFSYPYTAPAGWDLYTAFGVAGGTAREAVSGVYHRTYYEYDGSLNVTRELVRELAADGSAMPDATTQYSYDPDTNVLMSVTTPTGEEIELTYGNGWKSSYVCRDMRLLSASPVRYFRTDADYDLRGRLIYRRLYMADSTHQPVLDGRYPGGCAYFHYDGLGRLRLLFKAETDPDQGWPNHKILRVEYDDENRTVLKTDARGYQVLTRYDPFFRPVDRYTYKPMDETCTMDYNGWKRTELTHVRYSYDPAQVGLLLEETAFLGASDTDPLAARYGYDTLGRPTKAERVRSGNPITLREAEYSDATNTVLTRSYRSASEYTAVEIDRDWLGRPERESAWTEAGQAGTRLDTLYAYDPGGRLAAKTLPNGEVYSYAYTSAGRLTKTTYPNGRGEETRTYDLSGRLVASTDLNGSVTSLSYNPAGQLAGKTVSRNSVTEETVETTYCPHGPLTVTKYLGSSSVPEISSEYAYKFDGSVRRETRTVHIDGNPVASFVERELDDAGNLLGVTVSGLSGFRKTVRYSLPGFGEAVPGVDGYSVTARGESGGTIATSASTRLGRAVLAYGNGQVTAYSYDDWLGLAGIDNPGTAYDQSYARDYTGKIAEWTNHVGTRAFAYDGLGRLASGEGVAYGYDPAGNMTTAVNGDPSAFQYQTGSTGQNSMLIDATTGAQTGTVDYSTDPEGNVVQAASRFGAIGYDFSNRITSIADMARGVTDEYSYDQAGLRYRKDETVDGREIRTFTTYSGNDIVLEETFHGGGWETARIEVFVDGMNIGRFEKDYRTDPDSESLKYYYRDHLGSRIGVADEAGAVLATVSYDAWGNAAATGADGYDAEGEIRFTGKPRDATGLYYFNARYYDPQSKRFFTEDPIQSWMNWYAYCGNDPVNYTDPEGKEYYGHGNGDLKGGDRDIKIKDAGNKSPRELGRERDRQRVIGGSGPLVYSKKSGYILRSGWQDPDDVKKGMGWRTSVMEDDKKHFMNYGHLDPESTLSPGSKVEEGAPIGRMANPTNGRSSGPHVHVERRNANDGTEVHPGNESPYAGRSRRTSGYGDIDSMHSTPHSGVDHVPAADKVFDGHGNVYGL